MKISVIQLAFILTTAVYTYGSYEVTAQELLLKPVSVDFVNTEIKTALSELESQANVKFVYTSRLVPLKRKVTLKVMNQSMAETLEALFLPDKVSYRIVRNRILLTVEEQDKDGSLNGLREEDTHPFVLDRTLRGLVTDEKGDGLPGVSIILKGTQRGTVTGSDGGYEIVIPDGDNTLIFSFVGFITQEIEVGNRTSLDVRLEVDQKSLEEVVVVGYGTMKKSDLTGAVGQVKGEVLAERNNIQLSQALQGTIPGLRVTRTGSEPNSSATIRIRGITTIGNSEPLVIVDGVPGSIDQVSPNDVESISVLKDAASASIYGSRAAAGVILITTKRATKGFLNFSYNYEIGIESPTRVPQEVDGQTYMRTYNERFWNDNGNNPDFEYTMFQKDIVENYPQLHLQDPDRYPETDWFGLILRNNAPRQNHSLSFTAGGENIRTKAAIDYADVAGIYPGRNYRRITFRVNNDFVISKKFSGFVDINGIHGKNERPRTIITPNTIPPGVIYPAEWSDGRVAEGLSGANPYAQLKYGGFINNVENSLTGRVGLDFKPFEGFKISGMFAPTLSFSNNKDFSKKVPYTALDNPDYVVGYIQGYATTNLVEGRSESLSHITQFLASYSKTVGSHNLEAMLGYENYYWTSQNISATRNNFELSTFPYLNLGNANFQFNSGNASETAYRSWFGRVMYSYKGRYSLQVNGRHDASSRFAKEFRSAFFPSVSAGWTLSEEKFLSEVRQLSFLKLRASWGMLGNERIGDNYPYQSTIGFSTSSVYRGNTPTSIQAAAVNRYAIPDIGWETTESYDIGIDAGFFNNRLNLVMDYYKKTTKDMLLELEIPKYIGLSNPNQNAGKMFTRGWEFEIGWNDRVGQVTYGASFNITDSKSIMGDLKGTQFIGDQVKLEGSEYNEWYGYRTAGIFQTQEEINNYPVINANVRPGDIKILDISGPEGVPDGRISPEYDRVLLGGSLARHLYGGSIKLGYKNLDFSLFVQGVGFQNVQMPLAWVQPVTRIPELTDGQYWSHYKSAEENRNARYPRISGYYQANNYPALTDFWLFNGAYFRMKNISLGYTLPTTKTEIIGIKRARVYLTGTDLFSLSKFPKDRDPEGSSNFITSSYVAGISINF